MDYSLEALEFSKVKDIISAYLNTSLGYSVLQKLQPSSDIETVKRWFAEVKEAIEFLDIYGELPLCEVEDIIELVLSSRVEGSVFSVDKILKIRKFLSIVRIIKLSVKKEFTSLYSLVSKLSLLDEVKDAIDKVLDESGNVKDNASSELSHIRSSIRRIKGEISQRLKKILFDPKMSKVLRDRNVHLKGGRYTIAVRADRIKDVKGIVVDTSSSGQTVFVDPQDVVPLNNELSLLVSKEEKEIRRILGRLTSIIGKHCNSLIENQRICGYLDFVFAKAKFAKDFNASIPRITKERKINIIDGRHPLLYKIKGDATVPLNLELGKNFTTLIITGPNTGGKTVALKTIGILSLMAASGIPVTAHRDSEFFLFKRVLADIGDEQSIEQNLSTFSSHMKNIVEILKIADKNTLVLIDELGAGTDPEEGSALAVVIAEALHKKGSLNVITTHHSDLKLLAYRIEGIENASVGFDVDKLEPTYKLMMGIPGMSNALIIAERLGLSKELVEKARNICTRHDETSYIQKIKMDIKESLDKAKAAEERAYTLLIEAEKEAKKIKEEALREANRIIDEALSVKSSANTSVKIKMAKSFKRKIQKVIEEEAKSEIDVGDKVYVAGFDVEGVVLEIEGKYAEIETGKMRVRVPLSNLKLIEKGKKDIGKEKEKAINVFIKRSRSTFFPELNVRGYRVDDAIPVIDRFLNDGYLLGIKDLKIIHGKGEGILKRAVHEFLKEHPLVKHFSLADERQGSSGVTLVELDL